MTTPLDASFRQAAMRIVAEASPHINFRLGRLLIDSGFFRIMMGAMGPSSSVRYVVAPGLLDAGMEARYDAASNTVVARSVLWPTPDGRATLLHELIHMGCDATLASAPAVDEEAAAYLVEALYLRRVIGRRSGPDSVLTPEDTVITIADGIVARMRVGSGAAVIVDPVDLENLRSAIRLVPIYRWMVAERDTAYLNDGVVDVGVRPFRACSTGARGLPCGSRRR